MDNAERRELCKALTAKGLLTQEVWDQLFPWPPPRERGEIHRIRLVPKDELIEGLRLAGDMGFGHDLDKPFTWGPGWTRPIKD